MGKGILAVAALLGFLALPASALAADLCVIDSQVVPQHWRFYKFKNIKPGTAVPLTGVYAIGVSDCPVSGTALVTTAGELRVAVTAYCAAPIGGLNLTFHGTGTPDFNVIGQTDTDSDGFSNGTLNWTREACTVVP